MNSNHLKNQSLFIIEILFLLLPLALITGPFIPDLIIVISSIIFIHYCIKNKKVYLFKNKIFFIFLFFWFYLNLNSILINQNFDSIKISLFFIRFGIYVTAIVYLISNNEEILKKFFYTIFFCIAILILDGFFQYFTGYNIFGSPIYAVNRVSSFFGDELILGSYISRFFPVLFGLFIFLKNEIIIKDYLIIIIFILAEVLVFLSGERVSFVYINIAAIFSLIMLNNFRKIRIISLLSSIIILVLINMINADVKNRVINKTLDQTKILKSDKIKIAVNDTDDGIYVFSKQHTHHYITALKMFLDNKLLGVGIKNFRKLCDIEKYRVSDLSCSTHPHNFYIQLLSETGIIGFAFLFFIFIVFSFFSLKHLVLRFKKKVYFTSFQICMLSGILIFLWPIAPTGNIFNNWVMIISIIPVIFFTWALKMKK